MTPRAAGTVLALAGVIAACSSSGPSAHEPAGRSASAIQGGSADTTHGFAVGICGGAFGGPKSGNACQFLCSGALIAPNLVLTARHCVDTVSSATIDCSSSTFGAPLFPAAEYFVTADPDFYDPAGAWHSVVQILVPTEPAYCGNDVALLVLGSNVPPSEAPALATPQIWFPNDAPRFATELTAIGYGVDAPGDTSSGGTRRILSHLPVECIPGDPDHAMACAPVATSGIASKEFAAGKGLCEGDSGSSGFDQKEFASGRYLSMGVVSRGGTTGAVCEGSIYTQLFPWQTLILNAAKLAAGMGAYPLPAWTTPPANLDAGLPPPADAGADALADAAAPQGTSPLGAPCNSPETCASGECVALGGDAGSVCSESCGDGGACPTGFTCRRGSCLGDGVPASSGGCSVGGLRSERGPLWASIAWLGVALGARAARRRTRGR